MTGAQLTLQGIGDRAAGRLTLWGIALEPVDYTDIDTAFGRFVAFHDANPHVLDALIGLCLDARERGMRRWSTKGAFEVLRYASIETAGDDDFKLNNNYTALYARLIAAVEPRLGVSFFATREQMRRTVDAGFEAVVEAARARRAGRPAA